MKKKCLGAQTPQRMMRFPCLQDCFLTLTCHLALSSRFIRIKMTYDEQKANEKLNLTFSMCRSLAGRSWRKKYGDGNPDV